MWWHRAPEPAEPQNVVSFRRVGGIRPIGPDGTIRAYTARDLRSSLAGLAITLSKSRKSVAGLFMVVALAGWFVIPSYAAAPRYTTHLFVAHRAANAAPAQAPPQAPIANGPISVIPPKASTPVTGAGDGLMRTSIVGFSLLLAGFVLITAPRRNPYAEAVWREAQLSGA